MSQVKKHHILIAGIIVFVNKKDESVGQVPINGVLIQDRFDIPAASLGKAQKVLQVNFYKSGVTPEEVTIVDAVIQNLCYLGHFTQEEFQVPAAQLTPVQASNEVLKAVENAQPAPTGS